MIKTKGVSNCSGLTLPTEYNINCLNVCKTCKTRRHNINDDLLMLKVTQINTHTYIRLNK